MIMTPGHHGAHMIVVMCRPNWKLRSIIHPDLAPPPISYWWSCQLARVFWTNCKTKKKSFFLSLVVIQLKRVTHVSRTLRHSCSNSNASWWRCYSKLDVIIKGVYETKIVHMWVPACNSVSAEPFKSSVNADPLEKELIYIWQAKIASSRYVR